MKEKTLLEKYETDEGVLNYEAYGAIRDMMKTEGWQIYNEYCQQLMQGVNEELTEPAYREADETRGLPGRSGHDGMILKEFQTGQLHGMARILSWPETALLAREDIKKDEDEENG